MYLVNSIKKCLTKIQNILHTDIPKAVIYNFYYHNEGEIILFSILNIAIRFVLSKYSL